MSPTEYTDLPAICDRCLRTSDICVCIGPYLEILADGDQREEGIVFVCNTCDTDVTWTECPEHAPVEVPGLVLAVCDAARPHPRTWTVARENGYGAPCPWCIAADAQKAHEGCEHAAHGAWRAWWITRRTLNILGRLGLASSGYRYGGGCRGCRTHIKFGWRWAR